jgi:hypothetical protein
MPGIAFTRALSPESTRRIGTNSDWDPRGPFVHPSVASLLNASGLGAAMIHDVRDLLIPGAEEQVVTRGFQHRYTTSEGNRVYVLGDPFGAFLGQTAVFRPNGSVVLGANADPFIQSIEADARGAIVRNSFVDLSRL